MAPHPLPPVPQPLVKFERMTARQTQTLEVKELFDSFNIGILSSTLDKTTPWMSVEAKTATLHDRKKAYDNRGQPGQPGKQPSPLFDIVRERLHTRTTFSIQDDNKKEFMKVRSKFSGKWLIPN